MTSDTLSQQAGGVSSARAAYGRGDSAWFVHERFGMFIHWGLYALPARHEWVKSKERIDDARYQRYFEHFDPDLYDPEAWAAEAKAAGMRYVVLTAKHHEGFCLWDSAHTDYKAPNTPCGRDLLRPFVEAFRAAGLKVGFYYSLIDWHHPDFTIDQHHPQRNDREARAAEAGAGKDMRRYARYMRDQVHELLTDYGDIDIIWFDFSYPGTNGKGRDDWESERLIEMVRELRPNILVDNRLDLPGSGDFVTPEQYQPATGFTDENGDPVVWEACQTFSGSWGYHRDEAGWKDVDVLLRMLIDGVSKGGNLLLNVGPTARGEFDHRACERLRGIGAWMHRHERSIRGCGAAPFTPPTDVRYTWNPETRRLYVHLFVWPFKTLVLPGLAGRVRYAQLLDDASEVFHENHPDWTIVHAGSQLADDDLILQIPAHRPPVAIPVIELFMAEG